MNHQEVREFCAAQGITPLAEPTPFTPAIDPRYEFRKELLVEMVAFWLTGKTSMKLMGYKGCGKTTLPEQFHAALNYPLLGISCTPRTEASDLIGKTIATPEGLKYSDGPLVMGAKFGCSVMLDEYNVMDPGEATGANKLLEGGAIYIPETGEVVRKAPGFRIFASCNPADKSLGFFGRNEQDQANDDRFWTIWVDYPKPEDEAPIVQRILEQSFKTDIAKAYAEKMVSVANKVRKAYMGESDGGGALETTLSTRGLTTWADGLIVCCDAEKPVHFALARAVTNSLPRHSSTKEAIHQIVTDEFGE